MAESVAPADVLAHLREADPEPDFRQVGMMAADGRCAQWTGANCVPDAGHTSGENWAAQANMVASPRVWEAMGEAFEAASGTLAERLMDALDAAEREGGDWRGRGGAAVVVVPGEGEPWESVVDVRVEQGDGSLVELRGLVERSLGYREANRATTRRREIGVRRGLPAAYVQQLALRDAVERDDLDEARAILAELEGGQPRWRDFVASLARHPEMGALARLVDDD
jgi:uncharacterized Ntn-hydrolase superfamily protein